MAEHYAEAKSSPKRSRKRMSHMEIHEGESGGHIVKHVYEAPGGIGGSPHEPENHVFGEGDGEALLAHIAKHAHISVGAGGDEQPGGKEPSEPADEEPAYASASGAGAEQEA